MTKAFQGLGPIGQIAVNARSIERATAFYRDTLGMKHLFSAPPKMSFFDCGGIWLLLGEPEAAESDHPSSILYFDVPDIAAAHAVLAGRGVEFRSAPHLVHRAADYELWLAFFRDSEGNSHALRERRATP